MKSVDAYGAVSAHVGPIVQTFAHQGWEFHVCRGPMQEPPSKNKLEVSPEAYFGLNILKITAPTKSFTLRFTPMEFLRGCHLSSPLANFCANPRETADGFVPTAPQARGAARWQRNLQEIRKNIPVQTLSSSFDWTFASKYRGSAVVANGSLNDAEIEIRGIECPPEEKLPTDLLSDQTLPILWFQQVDLYDDDLSDCGVSRADVKLRVMPTFFYILMRQDIRVDGVMARQIDTRFFHEFESDYIVREFLWKESQWDQMRSRVAHSEDVDVPENIERKIGPHLLNQADIKWRLIDRLYVTDS